MKINILISTIDDRIQQVSNVILEPRSDVKYIVSHQFTDGKYKIVPPQLNRPDVAVSHIPGKGIAKSRNNALKLADGDIGLIADDDVTYCHSDIDTLKKTFFNHTFADVAIFKIRTPSGEPPYSTFPDQIVNTSVCRGPALFKLRSKFRVLRKIIFGLMKDLESANHC